MAERLVVKLTGDVTPHVLRLAGATPRELAKSIRKGTAAEWLPLLERGRWIRRDAIVLIEIDHGTPDELFSDTFAAYVHEQAARAARTAQEHLRVNFDPFANPPSSE